jgi:hypothetical protein
MNHTKDDWEMQVQNVAKAFPYPPTPDIAGRVQRQGGGRRAELRRVAQAAAVLLIVLVALLAVPEIRAQVLAFFRIGAVEVIITTATPPANFASGGDLPASVLDFPGATTLDDAEQHAGYPTPLPSALGAPDHVYLIGAYHPIVVLTWLDASGAVEYSLHLLPAGTYAVKMYDGDLEETEVNGARALWLPNPHLYLLRTGQTDASVQMRQVRMHALVWAADGQMTYRLETNHPLEDALRIAESIGGGNG